LMAMLDEHFNSDEWRRKVAPLPSPSPEAEAVSGQDKMPAQTAAAVAGPESEQPQTASGQPDGEGAGNDGANGVKKPTVAVIPTVDEWVCFCAYANSCALDTCCKVCDTERNPTFRVRKRLATATEAAQALSFEKANLEAASASAAELVRLLTLEDQDPGAVVWEYARHSPSHHHNGYGDHNRWVPLSSDGIKALEKAWTQESDNAARTANAETVWLQSVTAFAAAASGTATATDTTASPPASDSAASSQNGPNAGKHSVEGADSTPSVAEAARAVLTAAPNATTKVTRAQKCKPSCLNSNGFS